MKTVLITLIVIMSLIVLNDVERNANANVLNYTQSIAILPFLALAIYAVTHLDELKKLKQ